MIRYIEIDEKTAKWLEVNSFGYKQIVDGTPTFIGIFPSPDRARNDPIIHISILYYDDKILLGFEPTELIYTLHKYTTPLGLYFAELIRAKIKKGEIE